MTRSDSLAAANRAPRSTGVLLVACVLALAGCVVVGRALGQRLPGEAAGVRDAGQHDGLSALPLRPDATRRAARAARVENSGGAPGALELKRASAEARPAPSLALLVGRACWLEATWRHDDCASIAYVLKRRAARVGWSIERMTVKYSALDSGTERARKALRLPIGFDAGEMAQWHALVAMAAGALAGTVADPTPRAMHWGARNLPEDTDRAAKAVREGRWRLIRSATANAFYAERRAPRGERVLSAVVAGGRP